ncbi:MAG: glycosyltransferase [Thermoflexales bacterium]
MRILFTFIGGSGHFLPLVPVARATATAGHVLAFGCGPSMRATVEAAGFPVFPLGTGAAATAARLPLRPLDAAREDEEFLERFVRLAASARANDMLALCGPWRPDLIVCDEADFGSMLAAERLGLPHATVLVMAAGSFVRAEVIGEALNALRAAQALPPDPGLEILYRHLALSPFPPSFRDPAVPLPATAHAFRATQKPAVSTRPPGPPIVYFTLGTVFNIESGDLFARALAGLRELPIRVVATVGEGIDPAEFGPQPANVRIERYIAQELILPECSLVVSHGGSGSVLGALAHGLPMVLIPMGADQPLNAARCEQLNVGRTLDPIAATPASVLEAVSAVLADPCYRRAAEIFRDEIAGLPGPDHAVRLLQTLVATGRYSCGST